MEQGFTSTFQVFLRFYCKPTVSNKNTHLADFEACVFRGYLRNHLSYKKVFNIYLQPFQIRSQNQLIFTKTLFCQQKSKLLEKIRHFEKFKNFFSWIKGVGVELTYKLFSGSNIVMQPLQVKLDVFALFL